MLGLAFDRARSLLSLGRAPPAREEVGSGAPHRSSRLRRGSTSSARRAGPTRRASELARVGARKPQQTGELTPAEQRVAELATEGLSNKEIAQALFVTVNTVEAHLSHAYAKLGVRSRAQLARAFAEHR